MHIQEDSLLCQSVTYIYELEVLKRQVRAVTSGSVGARTVVSVPLLPQALPQVLVELPPLLSVVEL